MGNKKLTLEKKIIIAEIVLILGILVYLAFSIIPKQIYPLNGMTIIEPNFAFEIQNGQEVLLSVYEDFRDYVVLTENSEVNLAPGTYYWKVRNNFVESEMRIFTVQSHVGLRIKEGENSSKLINSGNVDIEVEKKTDSKVTGLILGVNEIKEVEKDNSTYEGSQK
jgi:hypothetical protein